MRHNRWINKVLLFALIIAILSWPIQANASGSYSYYMPVTIQSSEVDDNLTDFPVVINSTISELATTANGGYIENTDANGFGRGLYSEANK